MEITYLTIRTLLGNNLSNQNICEFKIQENGMDLFKEHVIQSIKNDIMNSELLTNSSLDLNEKQQIIDGSIMHNSEFIVNNINAVYNNTPC